MGKGTPYIQKIGPITSTQFGKVQTVLNDHNELVRMRVLYNMLVLMKQQEEIDAENKDE